MKFFMAKGWTREQSAGIVANLIQESGLNPGVTGDGGSAYGIAQWHEDRQKDFQNYTGKSIIGSSATEQMEFVNHELTAGKERAAGNRLRSATTASQAGSDVSKYYERPLLREAEAANRGSAAERIFRIPDRPGNTALPDGASTGDAQTTGGRITSDDITIKIVGPDGKPAAADQTIQTRYRPQGSNGSLRGSGATGSW